MLAREGDERLSGTSKTKASRGSAGATSPDKKKRRDKRGSAAPFARSMTTCFAKRFPRTFLTYWANSTDAWGRGAPP
jgi:hypothetical protein